MKISTLILSIVSLLLFSGCAQEAYYIDQEFGEAQMESWDKMIAYPAERYADKQPEGLEGIHAEPAMDVYHRSFSKEPTKTNVIKFGIVGE